MRPEPGLWPFPWQMGKPRQRAAKCAVSGSWGTSQDCLGPPAKVRIPEALQEALARQTGSACFFPHNPQSKAGWFPGLSSYRLPLESRGQVLQPASRVALLNFSWRLGEIYPGGQRTSWGQLGDTCLSSCSRRDPEEYCKSNKDF